VHDKTGNLETGNLEAGNLEWATPFSMAWIATAASSSTNGRHWPFSLIPGMAFDDTVTSEHFLHTK
jgi:hypothetical protein